MSETLTLAAEIRKRSGKGGARATRRDGKLPGIIYGGKSTPETIELDPIAVTKAYHRGNFQSAVLNVEIGGKATQAIPREVQLDPVMDHIIHVDFMRVDASTRVAVAITVNFINEDESPGLTRGGVLNVVRHDVELMCPATAIPEYIEGDLTGLEIGDSLKISAFTLPDGVMPTITDRDFTIVTIVAPSDLGAEEEAEEGIEGEEGEEGAVPTEEGAEATEETSAADKESK